MNGVLQRKRPAVPPEPSRCRRTQIFNEEFISMSVAVATWRGTIREGRKGRLSSRCIFAASKTARTLVLLHATLSRLVFRLIFARSIFWRRVEQFVCRAAFQFTFKLVAYGVLSSRQESKCSRERNSEGRASRTEWNEDETRVPCNQDRDGRTRRGENRWREGTRSVVLAEQSNTETASRETETGRTVRRAARVHRTGAKPCAACFCAPRERMQFGNRTYEIGKRVAAVRKRARTHITQQYAARVPI